MKRNIILTFFIFVVHSISISAQNSTQSLTIKTLDGNRTIKVYNEYVTEERRYYLEYNEITMEVWQIFELRYNVNGLWTDWKNGLETIRNYSFTNRDLQESVSRIWEYSFIETSPDGIKIASVPAKNEFNQMYWWVDRKYIHTLRRIYFIVN